MNPFILYPLPQKTPYIKVIVCETIKEYDKVTKYPESNGMFRGSRGPNKIGTLYFIRRGCFTTVVAHECLHAALEVSRFFDIPFSNTNYKHFENEEFIAHVQAFLFQQLLSRLTVYKDKEYSPEMHDMYFAKLESIYKWKHK